MISMNDRVRRSCRDESRASPSKHRPSLTPSRGLGGGRLFASTLTLASLVGCNNPSNSILAVEVAAPTDPATCVFPAAGELFWAETFLNTVLPTPVGFVQQLTHTLFIRTFNDMRADDVIVEFQPAEVITLPNRAAPLRFDFRWECESNGFSVDQGPFFLPQFSLTQPFCLNDRDEAGDFIGFDAVPASGPAIGPQEFGLVAIQPIPPQLGLAFDEFFQLATLANLCCQEAGGCDRVVNANITAPGGNCTALQNLFNAVSGGVLNANQPADVRRWQPFSIYDGSGPPAAVGAFFPLRLRGRFEFLTASGETITTTELAHKIGICRNCAVQSTPCTL